MSVRDVRDLDISRLRDIEGLQTFTVLGLETEFAYPIGLDGEEVERVDRRSDGCELARHEDLETSRPRDLDTLNAGDHGHVGGGAGVGPLVVGRWLLVVSRWSLVVGR